MPGQIENPSLLHRSWTHAHEEDHDDLLVWRPSEQDFPPARGRRSFELGADGRLTQAGPGPDDRTVRTEGTWSLDGDRLTLYPAASSPLHYLIEELGPDRLVVHPVD